jgi:hypothetical protein
MIENGSPYSDRVQALDHVTRAPLLVQLIELA